AQNISQVQGRISRHAHKETIMSAPEFAAAAMPCASAAAFGPPAYHNIMSYSHLRRRSAAAARDSKS
ncbi:MAG: hypothetical protein ACTS8S_23495, partial [Giesbergeria sp.]